MGTRLLTRGKKDANQAEIVLLLRKMGAAVWITDKPLDLWVSLPGKMRRTVPVEIKDGRKVPSARQLTSDEQEFVNGWPEPCYLVSSLDDAINLMKGKGNVIERQTKA